MSTRKSRKHRRGRSKSGKSSKRAITDPAILLAALAHILTECEKSGINPKLKHGIVYTNSGYVLPVKDRWAARPLKKH